MSEANPYEVPQSSVEVPREAVGGSLENALAGNFSWSIGDVLNEAWRIQSGFKLTAWLALIVYMAILFAISFAFEFLLPAESNPVAGPLVSQLVVGLLTYPLMAGLVVLAIKRAAGMPVQVSMVFDYYGKTLPIFLLNLLMTVLIVIGFVLLIVPGIYLSFAYMLALPLLVEKNLGIWEALETSRKVISKCWFRFVGLILLMSIIMMVSAIPLGIGLIWTVPMSMLVLGIVYRDTFGVNEAATVA
jgi:hypothetical protein